MANPPPPRQLLKEARAAGEFARFLLRDTTDSLPRGDGHAVIVYPGFLAGDSATWLLRRRIGALGYRVFGWGEGANLGLKRDLLSEMRSHLVSVAARTGGTVSLFGWSLGGIYARELAKRRPDLVRRVVTAGTPASGDMRANHAWRLYEALNDHPVDDPPIPTRIDEPPPVPLTAIYTGEDGIVAPESVDLGEGATWESVRVSGSHVGLAWSNEVLAVLADRLARREGQAVD